MSTSYAMSDTLPKDSGGAKFAGWIDVSTSQLDFALPAGIGSRTTSSKILAALQVGTYVGGSRLDAPFGIALVGHFTSAVSAMGAGQAMPIRADASGQLYTTGLSRTANVTSASQNIVRGASGIVYGGIIAGSGVVAGGCVVLLDSGTSRGVFVFDGANQTYPFNYGEGAWFGTNIRYEVRNTVGTAFVTLLLDS